MRVTLSPAERAIVEVTLAIANSKRLSLRDFRPLEQRLILAGVRIESLLALDLSMPRDIAGMLRAWLATIARKGRLSALDEIAPRLGPYLAKNALRPSLENGKLVYTLGVNIIPGLLAYGVALILDRSRGLTYRLGQCGYCGRFNLTFEGRPKTHCSEAHRLKYDRKMAAERMREYRKRKQGRERQ